MRGCVEGELGGALLSSWKKIKLCIKSHLQDSTTHTYTHTHTRTQRRALIDLCNVPLTSHFPIWPKIPFSDSMLSALVCERSIFTPCWSLCCFSWSEVGAQQRDSDAQYSCNALWLACCCALGRRSWSYHSPPLYQSVRFVVAKHINSAFMTEAVCSYSSLSTVAREEKVEITVY